MEDKHKLIYYPDPILRQKAEPVDRVTPTLIQFIDRMKEVCADKKGLGIAAPQVNESISIFVTPMTGTHIKTKDPIYAKNFEDWTVIINPKIIRYSQEYVGYEEGCLSLPKLFSTVFRPKAVDVVYQDLNMNTHSKVLTHWFARLFLHEYDHLQGILFTDYLLGKTSNGAIQETPFDEKIQIQKRLNEFELEARG